jgi:adenylate cyclase, class 2
LASTIESEVKLRMTGPSEARALMGRIGATPSRPRHFEDNILFDDAASSLASSGRALRLRRTDAAAIVTYKGPKVAGAGVKSRPEIEVTVGDADSAQHVLEALGYRKAFRYQKYREAFRWRDAEIVVDETPIGTFLEVEGPIATIHAAAAALGRGPADYVEDSYSALFLATGRGGDMVFA